ncbi:MAG: polymorphic toxin type 10 domain-containing protein [Luteolibacter sp.]
MSRLISIFGLLILALFASQAEGFIQNDRCSLAPKTITNPVPSTMARVIPGEGPFPTLGLPGSKDVFVTAADDIAGMSATQLSKRLAIDPSDTFSVIRFPTPFQGVATPINRTYPQFIGGGRTAGGVREFVIPNQPVPRGATTDIIR